MITHERAIELFYYDGCDLRWIKQHCRKAKVGEIAGCVYRSNGKAYRKIGIDNKRYVCHQIVWLHQKGEWPSMYIDHIDGNGLNNRIENLRLVTRAENQRNMKRRCHNKSGATGVWWCQERKRWCAYIFFNGKKVHLGRYTEISEAISARKQAEKEFGFHPNHGSDRPL